jgi:hypothetical protein
VTYLRIADKKFSLDFFIAQVFLTLLEDVNEMGDGRGIFCALIFTGISRYTGFFSYRAVMMASSIM